VKILELERRTPGWSVLRRIFGWSIPASMAKLFFHLFYQVRCHGLENIPRTGAHVYVANHQSHLDPPFVSSHVGDRPCGFLARASLFRPRPFGAFLRFLNAIPLDTERAGTKAFRGAFAELAAGRCILVFPEGSRTRDGVMGPFKPGVLLLLRRSRVSVVPVAVEGAYDIWSRRRGFPRLRGRISIRIGPPITNEELLALGREASLEHMRRTIETMRLELRAELRDVSGGRYPAPGAGDLPYWESPGADATQPPGTSDTRSSSAG